MVKCKSSTVLKTYREGQLGIYSTLSRMGSMRTGLVRPLVLAALDSGRPYTAILDSRFEFSVNML